MRTEKIHKFLLSPITWGVVGLIIAAIAFSGMVSMNISYILLFLAFLVGCFGIFRAEKKMLISAMFCLFLGTSLALISYLIKPTQIKQLTTPGVIQSYSSIEEKKSHKIVPSPEIKLEFKNSPLLTLMRRNKIKNELNTFRNYLIGIGFEVPKETPPFGIGGKGKGWQRATGPTDEPTFYGNIYINSGSIDDLAIWRSAYAHYVFNRVFQNKFKTMEQHLISGWTIAVFTDYFISSYANKRPKNNGGMNGWVNALWDIREACGKEFVDKSLYYSSKNEDKNEKDFNKYFSNGLFFGAYVMDNDFKGRLKITEILREHKLL
jgi:hypothetical protein